VVPFARRALIASPLGHCLALSVWLSLGHVPTVIHFVIAVLIASLWTAYLMRSSGAGTLSEGQEKSVSRAFD
jgi:hypothetical protein